MRSASIGILLVLLLFGCSSISIVPKPDIPGSKVNPSDQSIIINNSGLTVSARVQDTAVGGYDIAEAIGSFYLTIQNNSGKDIETSLDSFHLIDSKGGSHEPMAPEDVNAILNPQIASFIPYPFVGFYDVVDQEQYRASTAMASERAYVGEGLSGIDELIPLPPGKIKPGQTVSGTVYFNIEIIDERYINLKAAFATAAKGEKLSYSFPFAIEK